MTKNRKVNKQGVHLFATREKINSLNYYKGI